MIGRALAPLAYLNVVIAASALSLTYATSAYAGFAPSPALLALSFFATLFVYTLDRLAPFSPEDEINAPARTAFLRAHRSLFLGCAVLSALACALMLPLLAPAALVVGGALAVVVVLYAAPIVPTRAGMKRGKDFGITKPLLVAFVWSVATVIVPVVNAGRPVDQVIVFVAVYRFLFVLAATLAFELRDVAGDAAGFPHIVGESRTLWIARACLVVAGVSAVAGILVTHVNPWLLLPVCVIPALLALLSKRELLKDERHLGVYVDGALALPGAIALVLHLLGVAFTRAG
jgi:4-hydroxybenzoate polyprenyltransferase